MSLYDNQQLPQFGDNLGTRTTAAEPSDHQLGLDLRDNELQVLRRRCRDLEDWVQKVEAQRDTYVRERDNYQLQTELLDSRCRTIEAELVAANDELNKARSTIKIQSQTIEGRTDSTALVWTTRDRRTSQTDPPVPPVSQFGENYGFGIKSIAHKRNDSRVDPRERLYAPPQRRRLAEQITASSSSAGPRPDQSFSAALTIRPQQPRQEIDWSRKFTSLFLNIEKYCLAYLNVPDKDNDQEWPLGLGYSIVEESSAGHVLQLAANKETRYLLVTRIVIGWIDNRYFHARIIKGFSAETDQKVQDIRRQARPDNHIDFRRGLAQAEASTIEEITRTPGFDRWRQAQIQEGVNTMMPRLKPAMAPGVHLPLLGNAFGSILEDAWEVGLLMATCTDQFDIQFPTAGPATRFDPRVMINRDPYFKGPPTDLERQGARVALGITPYITVKDILAAKMEERPVHMATVLLRY
ncbi:MAG: hypothetical protein L6R40_000803 [Gallowayella cf. fulva]|nr:MAG: hypothetical protein L6R40_000803 [Xanthomendoza cf. fulva]